MQPNRNIQLIEKIISIFSYFSMGIVGLVWILLAHFLNKKLKYFLRYNILQSILISVFLVIFKILLDIILPIIALIPFLDGMIAIINFFLRIKIIFILCFEFSIFEFLLFLLLLYISIGVILGKNFYVPIITRLIKKAIND